MAMRRQPSGSGAALTGSGIPSVEGRDFTLTLTGPSSGFDGDAVAAGHVAVNQPGADAQRRSLPQYQLHGGLLQVRRHQCTDSTAPGRFFFICTGVCHTSSAPRANSRSCA